MVEAIVLGFVQGVAEWLPVSSEGLLVLVQTNFFGGASAVEMIRLALFLHLGTFFAALIYFRKDVMVLLHGLFSWRNCSQNTRNEIIFLITTTLISGALGFAFLQIISGIEDRISLTGKVATLVIGILLLATAGLQFVSTAKDRRVSRELNTSDGIILGFLQGFAALPGFSRSGLTVSGLLLRNFKGADALRFSFLMSLPIVLAGNIVLNIDAAFLSIESLIGLLASFVFGLITIAGLLKLANHVNFAYFVLVFALLTIISVFI